MPDAADYIESAMQETTATLKGLVLVFEAEEDIEVKKQDREALCDMLDALVWFGNYDEEILRRVERMQDSLDCLDCDGETADWREE